MGLSSDLWLNDNFPLLSRWGRASVEMTWLTKTEEICAILVEGKLGKLC